MDLCFRLLVWTYITSALFIYTCIGSCDNFKFFGDSKCEYQCHCQDFRNCDRRTGICRDQCEEGWFGPACQYSLAKFTAANGQPAPTWVTDTDRQTCSDRDDQSITVALENPQRLTWIRVVVRNSEDLDDLQLGYSPAQDPGTGVTCVDALKARVDDVTMDIACPAPVVINKVILSGRGVRNLCSLYISAGRNVAVIQDDVRQSSTFSYWYSRNAVDGDVGPVDGSDDQLRRTCTHTLSSQSNPWWSVTLSKAIQLNQIIIYNRRNPSRNGCCEIRLKGFTLRVFNDSQDENELFSYTDTLESYLDVYSIVPDPSLVEPALKVKISLDGTNSQILTLCEVLVFGEAICPYGRFGLACERQCNCAKEDPTCFVSTGGCPSGCAPGYTGEDCWTQCPAGRYGQNCLGTCSEHCLGSTNSCHHVNGSCLDGCDIGFQVPLCNEACAMTTYGQNCNQSCSDQCLNKDCHHVTGECRACKPGYTGEFCDEECPQNTFGSNCEQNCSVNCVERVCHSVTGHCNNCTSERKGDYCETVITQAQMDTGGGNNDKVLIGTVVGVTLFLVLVIIVVVALVVRNRRRRDESGPLEMKVAVNPQYAGTLKSPDSPGKPPRPARPLGGMEDGKVKIAAADGPGNVYTNVLPCNTAVRVEDLKSYLNRHARDSFLKNQFESVPLANSYTQKAGTTGPNSKKNRYRNIVPYDHSRVSLLTDHHKKHDDYINASHIKGYNNNNGYIASQAPNDVILNDFVRMIWEKNVDRIVMLTNLVESRKVKCTKYWPDDDDQMFGEIRMSLLTTYVYAEYTVRLLRLYKTGESARDVTQFHFTAWPDKSVPDSPWGLVDFYNRVSATPGTGTFLVHCSAGVGRTGTFIALCQLLQEAEETGKMDFLSTLWRLRQDRMSMIQTEDQYVFLHWTALVGYVTAHAGFHVKEIMDKLVDLGTNGYKKEFDTITTASADDTTEPPLSTDEVEDVYMNSRTTINKQKNRLNNILPKDIYRPELSCEVRSMGKYINAVLVPSVTKDRQDILTQLPLPTTVTDFWRLITQYHVGLVVAFETESKDKDETIGEFLPESESEPIRGALFEIQARVHGDNELWKELTVTVFKKRKSLLGNTAEQHHVTCLLCKDTSCQPQTVLEYQKKIRACRPGEQSRTLFMCRNGATFCGLMCVQSLLLDRLEVDQSLTVPLVVGAIRAIRPQVIPTVDQYKCLYDVLKLVHDSTNVYGNVKPPTVVPVTPSKKIKTEESVSSRSQPNSRPSSVGNRAGSVENGVRSSSQSSGFKSSPIPAPRKSLDECSAKDGGDANVVGTDYGDTDEVDRGHDEPSDMQEEYVSVEYANI